MYQHSMVFVNFKMGLVSLSLNHIFYNIKQHIFFSSLKKVYYLFRLQHSFSSALQSLVCVSAKSDHMVLSDYPQPNAAF